MCKFMPFLYVLPDFVDPEIIVARIDRKIKSHDRHGHNRGGKRMLNVRIHSVESICIDWMRKRDDIH